jgi:riboflavin synthase
MFTGIIEHKGIVKRVLTNGTNRTFVIESAIADQLKPDQSVSHNGVCLTVEEVDGKTYRTTAILETLNRSNLGSWEKGTTVNLERSVRADTLMDGHIVQGHVDSKTVCLDVKDLNGSWEYTFSLPEKHRHLVVHKGSIAINGVSLTISDLGEDHFTVSIIPYTWEHTNFKELRKGEEVNVEYDILGKYVSRQLELQMQGEGK